MTLIDFYKETAALIRQDLKKQKMLLPPESLAELCASHCRTHRNTAAALRKKTAYLSVLQKAYPGEGVVISDFDHLERAKQLENLVQVIAVNTEKYFFNGSASMLTSVSHMVKNPIVRWDFIIDSYQIGQSRLWGADAVRLVTALLDQSELREFTAAAAEHGLEVIIEINSPEEFERLRALDDLFYIVYLNGGNWSVDSVTAVLQQIPANTPALLNIASFEQCDVAVDAFVLDQARFSTADGIEKIKKSR